MGDAGWRLPVPGPSLEAMTPSEIALRFGAAVVVGGAIGLNRDLRGKPAGVRTHALVSLGSAVVTAVAATAVGPTLDPAAVSRVMQGIITGIGFLGAGVILHLDAGRRVRGLTTAATIWIVAALGIACGVADWAPVGLGVGLTLLVLVFGGPAERACHRLLGSGPRDARREDRPAPPPS
jgi:putative Mg2+ transporter-C (MgtC) family protein